MFTDHSFVSFETTTSSVVYSTGFAFFDICTIVQFLLVVD